MENSLWNQAHLFLLSMKEGDKYKVSTDKEIVCVKRTTNKVHLSNGVIVTLKKLKDTNSFFLTSNKTTVRGTKRFNYIDQIIRDIEGWMIYQRHCY
jgi:hypothetical protein